MIKKRGRPINIKLAKRVQRMGSRGLKFRKISLILGEDLKSVYRWSKYKV